MMLLLLACPPTLDVVTTPHDSEPVEADADADTDTDTDTDTQPPEDTGPWDLDGDGYPAAEDCDDSDPSRYPGAPEVCDGIDSDCDGLADDVDATDRITIWRDLDGDGFGGEERATACEVSGGWVSRGGDCDDSDPAIHPDAEDSDLDGVDDNCDGTPDEAWKCEGWGSGEVLFEGVTYYAYTTGTPINFGTVTGDGWACSVSCDSTAAEVYLATAGNCATKLSAPLAMAWGTEVHVCARAIQDGEHVCQVEGNDGIAVELTVKGY